MDIIKKFINGTQFRVYTPESMPTNLSVLDNRSAFLDKENDCVLPFRKTHEFGEPGLYDTGMIKPNGNPVFIKVLPDESQKEEYGTKKNFINFADGLSTKEYMENVDRERKINESHICNVEDRYHPVIHKNDEPTAQISKQAQYEMNHDIYKYRDQFGPNFNNDKRALEASSITIKKMDEIYTKFNNGSKILIGVFDDGTGPNPMQNFVYGVINEPDFSPTVVSRDDPIGKAMLSALDRQRNPQSVNNVFDEEEEDSVE